MAQLVHITGAGSANRIKRNGINKGDYNGLVYFMPVTKDYYVSHQWCRELKRSGIKCFCAVYFTLPDEETVWHGHYNSSHMQDRLSVAIGKFMVSTDQMGYEFYTDKRIEKSLIQKVVDIPKPIGWRYFPTSHEKKPCFCPGCLRVGEYRSSKNRKAWLEENESPKLTVNQAKEILHSSTDTDELYRAMWVFGRKLRRESPDYLFRIFEMNDPLLTFDGIQVLSKYSHEVAKNKLLELSKSSDLESAEYAQEILIQRGWLGDSARQDTEAPPELG